MTALGAPLRLALLVTGLCAIAPQVANAAAPESCPDRSDPDVDYLCPVGPSLVIPGLTDLGGWDEESHYSNILYGDIDGDGADEMVARGTAGIEVYEFKQTPGQWSQVAVAPVLPDREGWDQPRYHRTIQLGDIDGDGKDELVARSRDGMIVLRFVPGRRPGSGSWTLVTTSGPFSDRDAWGSGPRYYSTIKLSPIGRRFDEQRPTMQLIGRGSDGLLVYRWTGNGWQLIARLGALSDQAGWDEPEYYRTIMAWDRKYLVARGPKGLAVYELLQLSASPTDTDWRTLRERGPCQIKPDDQSYPCDTDTIQLVHGLRGVRTPAWPVVLARDPSGVGLRLAVFDLGQRQWLYATPGRSPWWPNEYDRDQYAETIQAADIDGDGYVEVIGRSEPGTLTMDLEIDSRQNVRWTKKSNSFDPSLVSDSWARAEYFRRSRPPSWTPTRPRAPCWRAAGTASGPGASSRVRRAGPATGHTATTRMSTPMPSTRCRRS